SEFTSTDTPPVFQSRSCGMSKVRVLPLRSWMHPVLRSTTAIVFMAARWVFGAAAFRTKGLEVQPEVYAAEGNDARYERLVARASSPHRFDRRQSKYFYAFCSRRLTRLLMKRNTMYRDARSRIRLDRARFRPHWFSSHASGTKPGTEP